METERNEVVLKGFTDGLDKELKDKEKQISLQNFMLEQLQTIIPFTETGKLGDEQIWWGKLKFSLTYIWNINYLSMWKYQVGYLHMEVENSGN